MALLKYFKPGQNDSLPHHRSCPSLIAKELKLANESVSNCNVNSTDPQNYNVYLAEERAQIGSMLQRIPPPGSQSNLARF